mmetsp:Transcript_26702/g.67285  ORF Transcript_26702/g.67285 Transcript_26702/m.67285 type:complete len:294 (-) Transcript_26702:296-1177(-)
MEICLQLLAPDRLLFLCNECEPFLLKKYGRFPRPKRELTIADVREQALNNDATTIQKGSMSTRGAGGGLAQSSSSPGISASSRAVLSPPRGVDSSPRSTSPGGTNKKAANYENQKPAAEIFQTKADYNGLKDINNFELAQMKLREDTMYVPPGSKFQAPHPMSNTRARFQDDPHVDMKKVMALRKKGGAVIPTSHSLTNLPLASDPAAVEFKSVQQLHKCRKKQMRSLHAPCERFSGTMMLGSQAIGWAQDDPRCAGVVHYKGPTHGITDSAVTQYYHNMKATNMPAILRYEG